MTVGPMFDPDDKGPWYPHAIVPVTRGRIFVCQDCGFRVLRFRPSRRTTFRRPVWRHMNVSQTSGRMALINPNRSL